MNRFIKKKHWMIGAVILGLTGTFLMFQNFTYLGRPEETMVMNLYKGFLQRNPLQSGDAGGYEFWVNQMRTAQCMSDREQLRQTVISIAQAFADNTELNNQIGANTPANNREFIRRLYLAFMGRSPDEAGWNFWSDQLNRGLRTRRNLIDFPNSGQYSFSSCPEFDALLQGVLNQGCLANDPRYFGVKVYGPVPPPNQWYFVNDLLGPTGNQWASGPYCSSNNGPCNWSVKGPCVIVGKTQTHSGSSDPIHVRAIGPGYCYYTAVDAANDTDTKSFLIKNR